MPELKVAVFYGGVSIKVHRDLLKNECPHIVVGTPGRVLALARDKELGLKNVRHFILDECDKMLESLGKFLCLIPLMGISNFLWVLCLYIYCVFYLLQI